MKLFERHPYPWKLHYNASECGNGGAIHVIEDDEGACVASSYSVNLDNLWEMYEILTEEQKLELGHQPFNPDWVSPPGHTIRSIQEERGTQDWEMAEELHLSFDDYQALIDGSYPIDDKLAHRLNTVLGASTAFWKRREANYRKGLEKKNDSLSSL